MLRNIITRKWFVTPLDVIKYISLYSPIDQLGLTVRQSSLHFLTDHGPSILYITCRVQIIDFIYFTSIYDKKAACYVTLLLFVNDL